MILHDSMLMDIYSLCGAITIMLLKTLYVSFGAHVYDFHWVYT